MTMTGTKLIFSHHHRGIYPPPLYMACHFFLLFSSLYHSPSPHNVYEPLPPSVYAPSILIMLEKLLDHHLGVIIRCEQWRRSG